MQDTFGLRQIWESPILDHWNSVATGMTIEEPEKFLLPRLQTSLFKHGDTWNEIELIEFCVAPIFTLVDFQTEYFKMFSERRISAVIGDYELYGEPDALIAKGTYTPKIPYFCFNEYKRIEAHKGDVRGQLLAELLAAQTLNHAAAPVYGVYVVEKDWQCVAFHDNTYCIGETYVASRLEDLLTIVKLLKALKAILIEIAQQDASRVLL